MLKSFAPNTIDAAIAETDSVDPGTPMGEFGSAPGYGVPSSALNPAYGDPGFLGDESLAQLVGLAVQKYGRTTGWTLGTVDAVNAMIDVCYDADCFGIARFVDQLVISPGAFSAGGDSGSLITDLDDPARPVGLLFAGSDTSTVANRIDLVLGRFNVEIDEGGPVSPVTDLATTALEVVGTPEEGSASEVVATVRNLGNQDIEEAFYVVLSDDGSEVARETLPGLAAGATSEISFTWTPLTSDVHALRARHEFPDDESTNDSFVVDVAVSAAGGGGDPPIGPSVELWQGVAHTDAWTTVTLAENYGSDMVVVCNPSYGGAELGPAIARVRNASGSSFEVGLARPWFGAFAGEHWSGPVHCMVTRAGVYSEAEHGVTMEAVRIDGFSPTDHSRSWLGQQRTYANSYEAPVVVGQVMGGNAMPGAIGDWSVFWSRGPTRRHPPTASTLFVGRHTGEDPTGRPPGTLAYIVIEAGHGTLDGKGYSAALGADTVRGVGNSPPYVYSVSGLATASTAIVSQAGMDGGDGAWAVLYGPSPVAPHQVSIACDEDWYLDSERRHSTEQLGYIVFE